MYDTIVLPAKKSILERWRQYHNFVLFFDDFPRYLREESLAGKNSEEILWEYDDLFKGTNANIYIPLWASACKGRGDILLDSTTLELIKTYHAWGYSPITMDGNPPDFIGQQFRFLCYLYGAALHDLFRGNSTDKYVQGIKEFRNSFLKNTVQSVVSGIRCSGRDTIFLALADQLADSVSHGDDFLLGELEKGEIPPADLSCYEAYLEGLNPPIQNGEERIINTAGINNCLSRCVIRARVQEACILDLSTDCGFGREAGLRACVRGRAYRETFLTGRRLRYPMRRIGERGEGRFRRITWEEAADRAAAEWVRIRDSYGVSSRFVHYSSGVVATMSPADMARSLLSLDGGFLANYNSYSSACIMYVMPYIYGDTLARNNFDDVLNSKLIILWGHNPTETVFGTQRNYYLLKAKEQGIPIIVIDPRQSDTAVSLATEWIGIRPSTDAALADAMAYVIWSEGLQDQRFMDTYCIGFDEAHMPEGIAPGESYDVWLFGKKDGVPKTPEWAESITGVSAATIRRLARHYATAKPACLMQGYGPQRTGNGEQTVRTIVMLTCLTGNVGIPGGSPGGTGGTLPLYGVSFPIPRNPYSGLIPSFLWTRAVEYAREMTPEQDGLKNIKKLDSNIKMIVNFAGNTLINQHSDINNTIRILKNMNLCEFILGSDVFMTPSMRFADLLLPAPSFFENENITPAGYGGNYLLYSAKIIEPLFGSRFEYDFIENIARRLGFWEDWSQGYTNSAAFLEGLYQDLQKKFPELPEYEVFKQAGGYIDGDIKPHVAYADQIQNPAEHPFKTPSGKIEIFSNSIYALKRRELPGTPGYVPSPEGYQDPLQEKYPLQLIGYHTKKRTHSIGDLNPWLEEIDPQRLWIHPDDAAVRNLQDGESAEIFNDRGKIRIAVSVTTRIVKGVVALSQGAWYTPDSDGVDTRGSINVLTSTKPTPLARGNPQHSNLVEVRKGNL